MKKRFTYFIILFTFFCSLSTKAASYSSHLTSEVRSRSTPLFIPTRILIKKAGIKISSSGQLVTDKGEFAIINEGSEQTPLRVSWSGDENQENERLFNVFLENLKREIVSTEQIFVKPVIGSNNELLGIELTNSTMGEEKTNFPSRDQDGSLELNFQNREAYLTNFDDQVDKARSAIRFGLLSLKSAPYYTVVFVGCRGEERATEKKEYLASKEKIKYLSAERLPKHYLQKLYPFTINGFE